MRLKGFFVFIFRSIEIFQSLKLKNKTRINSVQNLKSNLKIKKQITTCDDLFNRPGQNQMHKIDIEDNNYLPPMYDQFLRPYYTTNQQNYRDANMITKYHDMPKIDPFFNYDHKGFLYLNKEVRKKIQKVLKEFVERY